MTTRWQPSRRSFFRTGGTLFGSVVLPAVEAQVPARRALNLGSRRLPRGEEGVIAFGVWTGVLLTRNERSAAQIELPPSPDLVLDNLIEAAEAAADEAAIRSLVAVGGNDGTVEYAVLRVATRRTSPVRVRTRGV